jgi:type II secretory pathway component GspD/PulD (secretin)
MKIENIFALVVVALAPCLAAVAQTNTTTTTTTTGPGAPAPSAPAPAATPLAPPNASKEQVGDTGVKPPEPVVIAHGTEPDLTSSAGLTLTNLPGTDEVLEQVAFDAIPLDEAVRTLASGAHLNIQFDPRLLNTIGPDGHAAPIVLPTVSEKWKTVTSKEALISLLDNNGWQLVSEPHSPIWRVTAKDPAALEPLVTTVVELQYSNPSNIVTEVQATLTARSSIITDMRTHQLIVRTTEREVAGVQELIAKLDSATRQVLIEAKIVETVKDINSAKGIDWTGTLAAQHVSYGNGLTSVITQSQTGSQTSQQIGAITPLTPGSGSASITTNGSLLTTTIPGLTASAPGISANTLHGFSPSTAFLNADGVSAVLSFLNTDADTRSIAFPRTVALDGVQTELMVVQNIPIFEQQQSAPAAGASQGLATVLPNYDKEVRGTILNEVGVKLTVVPRIAGPTNVQMDLRPEISSVDTQVASDTLDGQVNTSPIFDRRSIITQAVVPSGYTLVLGGLENDSDSKQQTKVPILGDIPGIGSFFRSNNKTHNKDTILIFVTPTIIQDSDFQPGNSEFLKSKGPAISRTEASPWDSAKPFDWTKPNTGVAPTYQP